ncbi:heterokaryon incompatibility protein [Ilyonectria robusta]
MEVFVTCRLSNPYDIFAAITALAQPAARILKSRYLAGIWECDLVRGLLWRPCYTFQAGSKGKIPVTRPKPTRLTSESGPVVRAPSWSWAAVEGPIAQDQWEPPRIKRHRNPAFKRVRPKTVDPDRWSDDTQCDVDALHMPACELQLIGHVAEAEVLHDLVSTYSTPTKNWRQSRMPDEHGVLLAGKSDLCKTKDDLLGHVVAVGFFDVRAERDGVESVWVLPLVRDRGLILKRNADGKFSRIGWCHVEKDEWFTGQDEVEKYYGIRADRIPRESTPSNSGPTYGLGRFLVEVEEPHHRPPPGFQPTMSIAAAVGAAETRIQSIIAVVERPLLKSPKA